MQTTGCVCKQHTTWRKPGSTKARSRSNVTSRVRRRELCFARTTQLWEAKEPLPDAAFEADAEELLGFDGEFHGQFLEDFLAEAVHDHVHGVLGGEAA